MDDLTWAGSAVALVILGMVPHLFTPRSRAFVGTGLVLLWLASLTAAVFGEDDYINDGSSRWATRGATAHTLYFVAAAVAVAVATLFAVFARKASSVAVQCALAFSGFAGLIGGWVVLIAFVSN